MSKVAVVIPAINLWNKYSKPCIDSVKSSKHELRILFIDNGSTDETKVEAGKLVSATFSHKRNEEAWSCAKSWNYGVQDGFERGYDYVLILNNDIILHPGAIDRMVSRIEKGDVVMVTAMDIRGECAKPEDIFNKHSNDYLNVPEAEHPNFSAFMVNRECIEVVGFFDEEFSPAYFEDNSYHYKTKLAGVKAIVYPPALFYHFGSVTWNEGLTHSTQERGFKFERNKQMYIDMWGGTPGNEVYKTKFNK